MAVGGMLFVNGEGVWVRKVWESGDGRDAEYEFVRRVSEPVEGPRVVEPVGFVGQNMAGVELPADGSRPVDPGPAVTIDGEAWLNKMREEAAAWVIDDAGRL